MQEVVFQIDEQVMARHKDKPKGIFQVKGTVTSYLFSLLLLACELIEVGDAVLFLLHISLAI